MIDSFVINNGVLEKYMGQDENVTIPEGVTSIGNGVFQFCRSLTSITIPDSVTSIGDEAFSCCSSMTSIAIPDSVTSIGNGAFEGCYGLTNISVPSSITSIGNDVFSGCSSLTNISLPNCLSSIGNDAFSGCDNLTNISLPCGVTSIGSNAFHSCDSLTSIDLPFGVTSIGNSMFSRCSSLTSIKIPDSVISIGNRAFQLCTSLTSITLPNSVTSIGNEAFSCCNNLTNIKLPDSVMSIGNDAFRCCSSLTSITIPESVTSIGDGAFSECINISTIAFLNTIKLTKNMFKEFVPKEIYVINPGQLPNDMKPAAAVCFANTPDDLKSERGQAHLKYIKSNAAKLVENAIQHITLLRLMCENKLLTPEATEAYLAYTQAQQNTEAIAILLEYQQNKLTGKEKQKAADKAEARETKITDFVFSVDAIEQLAGKTFVVTGKLTTMTRDEFKACLDACGAILSKTLNQQTDYLITNTPDSGSAKNKKAEQLGVKKLTETEFNQMIGKE